MRVSVVVLVSLGCVVAGATAGPVAYASELHVPLTGDNLREPVGLGLCWGVFGALLAAVALSFVRRKHLWWAAAVAVPATWLMTFAGLVLIALNSQD